jgi:ABC-type bacteriocin/lantibiotic exporter with double-glycine peptidase domain
MTARVWRDYLELYRPCRARALWTLAASVALSLLSLPLLFVVRYVFDKVLPAGDVRGLILCAGVLLAATLTASALTVWIRRSSLEVTKPVILRLRYRLLERLYEMPRSFFSHRDQMALHTNLVQDTERVDMMSNGLMALVLPSALVAGVLVAALIAVSPVLVAAMLVIAPLSVWTNRVLYGRLQARTVVFRRSFERFSRGMLFVLQAMDLTHLKAAEELELKRQREALDELRLTSTNIVWFDALYNAMQGVTSAIASVLILVVGGAAIAAHRMTLGDLLAFYATARILSSQTQVTIAAIPQVVLGMGALRDVHALLENSEEPEWPGREKIEFDGSVALENVSFAYEPGRRVLRDIWLEVEAGSMIAVAGPNGSGKSSLLALVCGMYRPEQGRVTASGTPYERIDMRHLRRSFGVVPQEPLLFPGTVRENIIYGCPEASEEDIIAAAKCATAHRAILELPDGYDTLVGDGGMLLSGGQRQRIAIARALLGRPKLLMLDEPGNHLDAEATRELTLNLRHLPQRPAVILVSHDAKLMEHADVIWTLKNGAIEHVERRYAARESASCG